MKTDQMINSKNIIATQLMNSKLLTLHPKDSIQRADDIFDMYAIHHIPIIVDKRLMGLISQGDILAFKKASSQINNQIPINVSIVGIRVEDVMTVHLITAQADTTLERILELMVDNRINALPIVDDEKTLLGLVTSYDIMKFFKDNC